MSGTSRGSERGMAAAIGLGTGAGAAAVLLILLLIAVLLNAGILPPAQSGRACLGAALIGGLAAGGIAARRGRGRLLLRSVAPGAVLCLAAAALSLALHKPADGGAMINGGCLLCVLVGSAVSGILTARRRKRGHQALYGAKRGHKYR